MSNQLTQRPFAGQKIDICDPQNIWNSATIISCRDAEKTNGKRSLHGGGDDCSSDNLDITIAYDGWGPEWNETLQYPNARVVRHFSFTRQVKAFLDIGASRQKYASSTTAEHPMLFWPVCVQIRMPASGNETAAVFLEVEKNIYIEPYLPTNSRILPELLRLFPNCQKQQKQQNDGRYNLVPGAWLLTKLLHPFKKINFHKLSEEERKTKFPLPGFVSAYTEALNDHTTPGELPKNLFLKGSLVKKAFLVSHPPPADKVLTGAFETGAFEDKSQRREAGTPVPRSITNVEQSAMDKRTTNTTEDSSKRQCFEKTRDANNISFISFLEKGLEGKDNEESMIIQETDQAASESKEEPSLAEGNSTPCPSTPAKLYRANSIELTKTRVALSSNRQLTQSKISGRTLLPKGRPHDIIDTRYEQQLMQGMEPSPAESTWTGVSLVERAIAQCCETITDLQNSAAVLLSSGKELKFLAIVSLYCQTASDRSLALAVIHQTNQQFLQTKELKKQSTGAVHLSPIENFLAAGGLELCKLWLEESTLSLKEDFRSLPPGAVVDDFLSPESKLLLPLLEFLIDIPFNSNLVKRTKIDESIKSLIKLTNKKTKSIGVSSTSCVKHLLTAINNLKTKWNAENKSCGETEIGKDCNNNAPFMSILSQMVERYEILTDCEGKNKAAPWATSKILQPAQSVQKKVAKSLHIQRQEAKRKLHEEEQRKTEEVKRKMSQKREKLLGSLIAKKTSKPTEWKETMRPKATEKTISVEKESNQPELNSHLKRVVFADEKTWKYYDPPTHHWT